MTPEKAAELVNSYWVYKPDGKIDRWSFTSPGDCENYALLILAAITGSNANARMALLTGKAYIVYSHTFSGGNHAVLEYNGMFIDNRMKRWMPEWDMMLLQEKRRRFTKIELLLKLGIGML